VSDRATSSTIELLTPIWERILGRSVDAPDANFFDLGGDISMAAVMLAEIGKAESRQLPLITILYAPTIASLASVLEQPVTQAYPPIILLKAGSQGLPVFMAHGLGTDITQLFRLAQYIVTPRAIYGLQARGVDGISEPFDTIGDMAEAHIAAMKQLQPHGPYALVGYSLGGLVTLEIAQRLCERGEKVSLLAMIETFPHRRHVPTGQRLALLGRLMRRHLASALGLSVRDGYAYIVRHIKRQWSHLGDDGDNARFMAPYGITLTAEAQRLCDADYMAWSRYRPRVYPGKINYIKAEDSPAYPDNAFAVWGHLSAGFESQTVPGGHVTIVTEYFEGVAPVLSRYIKESS
jgi:acetoacetyl-CoA synthetase